MPEGLFVKPLSGKVFDIRTNCPSLWWLRLRRPYFLFQTGAKQVAVLLLQHWRTKGSTARQPSSAHLQFYSVLFQPVHKTLGIAGCRWQVEGWKFGIQQPCLGCRVILCLHGYDHATGGHGGHGIWVHRCSDWSSILSRPHWWGRYCPPWVIMLELLLKRRRHTQRVRRWDQALGQHQ